MGFHVIIAYICGRKLLWSLWMKLLGQFFFLDWFSLCLINTSIQKINFYFTLKMVFAESVIKKLLIGCAFDKFWFVEEGS